MSGDVVVGTLIALKREREKERERKRERETHTEFKCNYKEHNQRRPLPS